MKKRREASEKAKAKADAIATKLADRKLKEELARQAEVVDTKTAKRDA